MPKRQVLNRYLTEAEEKQLFDYIWKFRADEYAYRDWHWMMLLRQTAMRVGNLATFTVADARTVLADPKTPFKLRDEVSKRGNGYPLKFNDKACTSLRALLNLHSHRDGQALGSYPLVMSRQQGRGLSIRSFQARMQGWRISSGLPVDASPHWFRHTLPKRFLDRTTHSNPLSVVQEMLGHEDPNSTLTYTYPSREDIDKAMDLAS